MTRAHSTVLGQTLYDDFVKQYVDYGPRGRYPLTYKKFYQWVDLWGEFMYNAKPITTKTSAGKNIYFDIKYDEQLTLL
jgi:hypothetical protein